MNDRQIRDLLRQQDQASIEALKSTEAALQDAVSPDAPFSLPPSPIRLAQAIATTAVTVALRSLTAHVYVGLGEIADAIHDSRTTAPAHIEIKHFAPYGAHTAIDGTPIPQPTRWNPQAGEYETGEPFTSYRARVTCPTCLHQLLERTDAPDVSFSEAIDQLHNTMVFDSRDWALNRRDAWLYGIVVGWDLDDDVDPAHDEGAMDDTAARHGWDPDTITRLRRLHTAITSARRSPEGTD